MKEKISLVIIYLLSFVLVVAMTFIILPFIIYSPVLLLWLFGSIVNNIATPLFDLLTPAGTILLLIITIGVITALTSKKPNMRAAASYLPGMGAVYSAMYYIRKEEDEFVKFHALQGLILFVIASILFIISMALINLGMSTLAYAVLFLLFIVGGLLLIYMIYTAYKGEKVRVIS